MREREVQAAVREALGLEPGVVLWRNNVGQATEFNPRTHETRVVRYGLCVGSADLVGVLAPGGRLFCLECKAPGEHPTAEQRTWAQLVRSLGGFVAVVRSADEARAALARARAGALS